MTNNIKIRIGIIIAVILICLYGVIGIPKSKDELLANWKKNIHLGLDLSGGTQLVMQVQLQDAFKAAADNTIEALKQELQKDGINPAGDITRNDPMTIEDADKIEIDIKGVPGDKSANFRGIVNNQFAAWVPTALNSTDYKLTMKPSESLKLKQDTLTQTMATIERKINALGLAESSVQQTGRSDAEAELMIQLPGVDDPAHVKQLLQTQAQLEWDQVVDGPFNSREEALSKKGGIMPLNTKLVPTAVRGGQAAWYLVSRIPVVRGHDIRDASAAAGELNRWETNFVLTQEAAKKFGNYTEANIGQRAAIVVDGVVISAPTIQSKISDTGRITGRGQPGRSSGPGAESARRIAPRSPDHRRRADCWSVARRRFHPGRICGRHRWRGGCGVLHVGVLQAIGDQRNLGPDSQRGHSDRRSGLL